MSKFRKSRNKTDHENFKRQRSKVNIIVRKAKNQNYQNQLSESAKDPDKFWKTLKSTFLVKNKKNCQIFFCGECYIKWLEHHCKRFLIVATTIKWIAILLKDLHGAGTSWFRKSHFSETGKSSMRNKFYSCNYSILNLPLDEIIPVPGVFAVDHYTERFILDATKKTSTKNVQHLPVKTRDDITAQEIKRSWYYFLLLLKLDS